MVEWTEYERGWGQRPDGVSFYTDVAAAQKHINECYGRRDPKNVPDEYSNPTCVNYGIITDLDLQVKFDQAFDARGVFWLTNGEVQKYQKDGALIVCKDKPEDLKI